MSEPRDGERRSLAEHVKPASSEARIERQWSAMVAAGLPGAVPVRSRRGLIAALALSVAAGAAAAVLWLSPAAPKMAAGAWLESAQAKVAVRLEDGSRVELSPRSQLRLVENREQRVALELRAGRARFEVKHDGARPFSIAVGPAEVRVIGTRFELVRGKHAGGSSLRVVVSEGVVEVLRRDRPGEPPQRIHAGESYRAELLDGSAAPSTAKQEPSAALEPEEPEAAASEASAEEEEEGSVRRGPARAHAHAAAAAKEPGEDASAIFSRASLARRAGRMRDAADGYAALLERFPSDDRAGLSAFELGRIRMDALADPAGAIAALERSLQSSRSGGGASFHEDALARIVIASDALGRRDACRDARDRYLARYPNGVHAQVLQTRCR